MIFKNKNKQMVDISIKCINDYNNGIRYMLDDIHIIPFEGKPFSLFDKIKNMDEYKILNYSSKCEFLHRLYSEYCSDDEVGEAAEEIYEKMNPKEFLKYCPDKELNKYIQAVYKTMRPREIFVNIF